MTATDEVQIRSAATTQAVISLSSGESEFYSAVKSASIGLGSVSMATDAGIAYKRPVDIRIDATAGTCLAGRRRAGRVRHIHTSTLWLQRAVHEGKCTLSKEHGDKNPAELGTTHVEAKVILQTWARAGFVLLQGDSERTLRANFGKGHQGAPHLRAKMA